MRTAIIGIGVFIGIAGCSDDVCSVTEADDGAVQITCSGEPIDIEPCFASLPDLDGSGVVDANDCTLVGVGASLRVLCTESDAWWTLPACRASESGVIRVALGVNDAVSMSFNKFRHVFGTGSNFSVWTDTNDDGRYEQSEDHVISAVTGILGVERINELAVVGWGGRYAVTWSDTNQDGIPDAGEVAELPLLQPGELLQKVAVFTRATAPTTYAIAFRAEGPNPPPKVRAWSDVDADGQVDAAEIVDVSTEWGTLVDALDYGVHIDEGGMRRVWTPTQGTWATGSATTREATSGEARCADFTRVAGASMALCVERASFGAGIARVNFDGSKVALPFLADTIDEYGDRALVVRGGTSNVRQTVIWDDADRSGFPDEGELRAVQGRALYDAVRDRVFSFGVSNENAYTVETWHAREVTRYLGETCGTDEACAGSLVCRVSGNAPEARCVPPLL
mgnify:CR=1 FL=1